ncbi:Pr6Pr family membrane protein [Microbacterium sp.]|uniref:Pr6Pr family membrane protein n=1 Tax=Microbacterium sp. TaxID=51671 RepID=UPI003736AD08
MRIPPRLWSAVRIVVAALLLAAVIGQLAETLGNAQRLGHDVSVVLANYFSYFTIVSNLLAAIGLATAGALALRGRPTEPVALGVLLAAATTYLTITCIVYNALLRNLPIEPGVAATIPWSNEILHVWGPIFLVLDLLVSPGRRRLPRRAVIAIVLVPIVWTVYTLIRANLIADPVTGDPYWYPYPFLDPNGAGGWGSVLLYVVGIAVGFLLVGALVIWVTRLRGRGVASVPKETSAVGAA